VENVYKRNREREVNLNLNVVDVPTVEERTK
jgi:hypothetical protein